MPEPFLRIRAIRAAFSLVLRNTLLRPLWNYG
jgi:hypothetical protein